MGVKQTKPSSSWAISGGLNVGAGGKYLGGSTLFLILFDVEGQIFFPLNLKLTTIGVGLPVGITVSTFSPTFFHTSQPLWASAFNRTGVFGSADMTIGVGSGFAHLTFKGIDHSPYWLDIGGLETGISAGIGFSHFEALVNVFDASPNNGCIIAPGDPSCSIVNGAPVSKAPQQQLSSSANSPAMSSR